MKGGHTFEIKGKDGSRLYRHVLYTNERYPNGKKKQKWLTARTKHELQDKVNAVIHFVNSGGIYPDSKATVGEVLSNWMVNSRPNLSPRTSEGYQSIIEYHLIPAVGNVRLKSLKPENLQRYYSSKLKSGLSSSTVRHHAMLLHKVLADSVKHGILPRNPADALTLPKMQHTEMHILDQTQLEQVLESALDTPYFTLFHVDAFTGLRQSELLALQWNDVDLVETHLSVKRAVHHLRDGNFVFREPKTVSSKRIIALDPITCLVLRRWLDAEMMLCIQTGVPFKNDRLVFCKWDGQPLIGLTVTKAWRRLTNRLSIKNIRFHDIRHTHASLLLKQGMPVKDVAVRLGHASPATLLNIYAHALPGTEQEGANKFGEIYGSKIRQILEKLDSEKTNG